MIVTNQYQTVILGGGMAGMAAAISSARTGENPILLEKMDQPGKKILASGNGRCNLLNLNPPVYYGEPEFAAKVLGPNPVEKLTEFWHSLGLFIRYDNAGRGYPYTFSSSSVIEALRAELKRLKVQVRTKCRVRDLRFRDGSFQLTAEDGGFLEAKRIILATGGAAQPKLGGNLDAWPWLTSAGHTMVSPFPVLTPLITDSRAISGLSGIRVKCTLRIESRGQVTHEEAGELLFTDKGISGICVFQCARFVTPGESEAVIDLAPDLLPGGSLKQELIRRRNACGDDTPPELLRGLCLPKLGYAVCKQSGLSLKGEKACSLSDSTLERIAETVHGYRVRIQAAEGFDRAQLMAGGVRCSEVRPENMESRLQTGMHITGELLNVDGDTGGFNLMFACMSGILAGLNGREQTIC